MKQIVKIIHSQDAGLKLQPRNSGETSLNLSTELLYFIAGDEVALGTETSVTFRLNKVDFLKGLAFIVCHLPLYKSSSTNSTQVDCSSEYFAEQYNAINDFFGGYEEKDYEVNLLYREDGRIYLNGLRKGKFSLRSFLVEERTAIVFRKNQYDEIRLSLMFSDSPINLGVADTDIAAEQSVDIINDKSPRQIIYYGAPGTGKSHKIKSEIKVHSHLRTTFHPDSDYSTFVGAYKPKMEPTLLRDLSGHRVKDEKTGNELWSKQIVYDFVPQAFLKAYLKAWEIYPKKQYLIIEEINRGNCAQIFGDLFQLLDRNSLNFSDYPITADDDLQSYIKDHIKVDHIGEEEIARINEMYSDEYDDVFSAIKKGEMLLLPDNLYIWATMNTSDQSLFPIDSAFKRRWDWKYIPICDAGKGWKIKVDGVEYDWWNFVERINRKIWDATHSEDKKLGYFFCKADEQGVIAADKFVGKVLFYVYNDVFKDYGLDDEIFKDEDGSELLFHKYFNPDGTANEKKIRVLLENMKVKHGDSDNGGEAAKE